MIKVYGSNVIGVTLLGDVPYVVKTSESVNTRRYLVVLHLGSDGLADKMDHYGRDGGIEEFSSLLRYSL